MAKSLFCMLGNATKGSMNTGRLTARSPSRHVVSVVAPGCNLLCFALKAFQMCQPFPHQQPLQRQRLSSYRSLPQFVQTPPGDDKRRGREGGREEPLQKVQRCPPHVKKTCQSALQLKPDASGRKASSALAEQGKGTSWEQLHPDRNPAWGCLTQTT